jgi:hypothetical protein
MKVYVIVEISHTHALGTVQELVSQAFISEELAQKTLERWRTTSPPEAEFAIRELELKFGKVGEVEE